MKEDKLLFVEDIVERFKLSENTVRRKKWRKRTGIPLHKVGKRLCASEDEIEKWFRGLDG